MKTWNFLFTCALAGACARAESASPDAAPVAVPAACKQAHFPQQSLASGTVVIDGVKGPIEFVVEVAQAPREREIGMMCRTSLADDRGMLFVFERERVQSFWMKNTLIPLDMIFVDDRGQIVGVIDNATPLTLQSRSVNAPSRVVLELRGGLARTLGIRPGMSLRHSVDEPRAEKTP